MFPLKQPYIEVRALFGDSVDIFWWNGNITEYLEEKFFAIWRDGENITGPDLTNTGFNEHRI